VSRTGRHAVRRPLEEFGLWDKMAARRKAFSFDLELTARCNLDCRHCYIRLPPGDGPAGKMELTAAEIDRLGGEAASMGAIWCLISGGEPLVRRDLEEIYRALKGRGLKVSLFTNATLVRPRHIRLFRALPPDDVEVTVYGVTRETYERVTRTPGSFAAFERGLGLLLDSGLKVRLKAMAMRSNRDEFERIAAFCRAKSKEVFRFDPLLHLRFDRDPVRNREIAAERLAPGDIVALERSDPERFGALTDQCRELITPEPGGTPCRHLFRCGAGQAGFVIGADGRFRLCPSLTHPACLYDLRSGSLADAWERFVPAVRAMTTDRREYLEKCGTCPVINLCLWCPAHAYLETGDLDGPVDDFCRMAWARAESLKKG
jgi:radical SAM protein with 4Fe4S-binding SPASM domain